MSKPIMEPEKHDDLDAWWETLGTDTDVSIDDLQIQTQRLVSHLDHLGHLMDHIDGQEETTEDTTEELDPLPFPPSSGTVTHVLSSILASLQKNDFEEQDLFFP